MGKVASSFAVVFSFLLTPVLVLAAPTFGAEFTMTSPQLIHAPLLGLHPEDDISTKEGRELITKFARIVREKCGSCVVRASYDRYGLPAYKVTVPGNFSFMITLDPAVIEIVPEAATIEGFKKLEPLLQELVFETGKALRQTPHESYGGGHVHIGIGSAFGGNPVLLRNFIVDWLNHPDLMNSFTGSKYNAPTFYDLPASQEKAMREVIAEFDARLRAEGFVDNPERDARRGLELMVELARTIHSRVYTRTMIDDWKPTEKYQAINVTRLANAKVPLEQKTIELRFFAGQKSVTEFINLIEMLEGRIEHLKKSPGLITYEPLRHYTARETAERLEKFAREAKTSASNVRDSVQRNAVFELIPPPQVVLSCEKALTH